MDVQEAFVHKGYLVLFSSQSLLFVYKIDKATKKLVLVQRFKPKQDTVYADIEFDSASEMLYVLSMTSPEISVYHF